MSRIFRNLVKEEDGMGTVEIVIIIAVLVGIALIFKGAIIEFVKSILSNIFDQADTINSTTKVDSIVREITSK